MLSCCLATILVACGGPTSSGGPGDPATTVASDTAGTQDAATELRRLVDGDDEIGAEWTGIGVAAAPDVLPAADARATAAVVWIENYDDELTLDSVSEVVDCDDACVSDVAAWAEAQLASGMLPVVAGETMCGNCAEAYKLSFATVEPDGGIVAIEPESLRATIGDVDTPYEVMLSFGRGVRIRGGGAGWRAVDSRVVSDCDPFVTEYTMYSVSTTGEREQLAQRETSDNSCA